MRQKKKSQEAKEDAMKALATAVGVSGLDGADLTERMSKQLEQKLEYNSESRRLADLTVRQTQCGTTELDFEALLVDTDINELADTDKEGLQRESNSSGTSISQSEFNRVLRLLGINPLSKKFFK